LKEELINALQKRLEENKSLKVLKEKAIEADCNHYI